jgi:hypothetical protein
MQVAMYGTMGCAMSDMSGVYSDVAGPRSLAAAKLAVEDFGAKGMKIEIVSADNKPDVGASIANTWFDVDKVDVILDVPNSGVALAVSEVARLKNEVFLVPGAATSDLTGSKCNAKTIHWTRRLPVSAGNCGVPQSNRRSKQPTTPNSWSGLSGSITIWHRRWQHRPAHRRPSFQRWSNMRRRTV